MDEDASEWLINASAFTVIALPFIPTFFGLIYFGLLFTPLYFLPVLHWVWTLYDMRTTYRGGRRCERMRKWQLWKNFRKYFPYQLVKTAELDPSNNYIIGYHPHGKLGPGVCIGFGTDGGNISKIFPQITPHVIIMDCWFWSPIVREFLMALGLRPSSRESINYVLSKKGKGNAALIVIGGIKEIFSAQPYTMNLKLKDRKGFVRLAVKNGTHLVPSVTFGENEIFPPTIRKDLHWVFQTWLWYVYLGWALATFLIPRMPKKMPLTTVVGKPIEVVRDENASEEVIDKYHQQYIQSLQQLFDEYKTKVGDGYKDMKLTLY